jgi:hypothetical protein
MPTTKGDLQNLYAAEGGETARRPPGIREARAAAAALARTARSPGVAPSEEQETLEMAAPSEVLEQLEQAEAKSAKTKSGKRPRPFNEEELGQTAQMDRPPPSSHLSPRTSPIAMPVRGGPLAATQPLAPEQAYPQYPHGAPPRPGPMVPAPPPSAPDLGRPVVVVPPPPAVPSGAALHPTVPGQRLAPTISTTRDRGSSFLLGVLTFFLVLASLAIVAWLTMPYWRAYVEL